MKFFGRRSSELLTNSNADGQHESTPKPEHHAPEHEQSVRHESVPPSEPQEQRKFSEVEPLSEGFLRHMYKWGVRGGKYIRLGNTIFVSSGPIPGFAGNGLQHTEILEQALENSDVKAKLIGAEALQGAKEETIGPNGMTDAGKFDIYIVPANEPRDDGSKGSFRVFGSSASYGMAEQKGRNKTVEIASQVLGPQMQVENARHMDFS